ncbi:hypothetical protein TNCV_744841 [Trichonephila clavipes]|nr:hypothetical protein TNCV_744841 [Trichonephila clavipes]
MPLCVANLLEYVAICGETWIFIYDPASKRLSMKQKFPGSPRPKKSRMSKSKFKTMLIVFFDINGIALIKWVPSVKSCLKRAHFTSGDEVQVKTENLMKCFPKPLSRTFTSNGKTECESA